MPPSTRALVAAAVVALTATAPTVGAAASTVGADQLDGSGVVVDLGPGALTPPSNEAGAYLVADLDTGSVLAAKAAHLPLPPASTLKVLTALALLPELDPARVVQGTDEEVLVEGSKVGISPGLSYSVDLLFTAMLIDSGNDAAQALAKAAGGVAATVTAMNAVATQLGARDTHVVNPSGLDEPGQVTSAYDLALIARAAFARDDFQAYSRTATADLPDVDGTTYQIQNGNRLLGIYDGLIAGKNGYTTLARHTYVGAAERDGRRYLVSVMRTEGRAEDVAAALLDWAFTNGAAVTPVGSLVVEEPVPVISASPGPSAGASLPAPSAEAGTAPAAIGPDAAGGGGPGTTTTVGLAGVGLVGAVVALRVRAVRRDRARRAARRLTTPGRPARPPGSSSAAAGQTSARD